MEPLDRSLKDIVGAFLRENFVRDLERETLLKRRKTFLKQLLRNVGITTVAMVKNPTYTVEELNNLFQNELPRPNGFTDLTVKAFANFIEEKRQQANLHLTLGSTYNCVTRKEGIRLIENYLDFLHQRSFPANGPRTYSSSHVVSLSYENSDLIQLNFGVEFGEYSASIKNTTEKTSASSTIISSSLEQHVCRKVDIGKLPKPLSMARYHPNFVRYIGKIIYYKSEEKDDKAAKTAQALFAEFGTHYCQEDRFGASIVKCSHAVDTSRSRSHTYGGDGKVRGAKFGGGRTVGNKNSLKTVDEIKVLLGKVDNKGVVTAQDLVASMYAPIWTLFEIDAAARQIADADQLLAQTTLRDYIKQQWELYASPAGFRLREFLGYYTNGTPRLGDYVTINNETVLLTKECYQSASLLHLDYDENGNFALKRRIGTSNNFYFLRCTKKRLFASGIGLEHGATEATKLHFDERRKHLIFVDITDSKVRYLVINGDRVECSSKPGKTEWYFEEVKANQA